MSSISYRTWEIWKNSTYFEENRVYGGWYECIIEPTLMAPQTIEFIIEKFQIQDFNFINISPFPSQYKNDIMFTSEGELCLKIYTNFQNSEDISLIIKKIEEFINIVSLLTDFPIICNKIRFIDTNIGKIFISNRKPIGRAMAFKVEERGLVLNKIKHEKSQYDRLHGDNYFQAGLQHYLTGMKLLSLEDKVNGLLDASFMQFYQGCEVLCEAPEFRILDNMKKFIANKITDSKDLQIICHQVFQVRNKYFGHGNENYNIIANRDIQSIKKVSNQILVVRYLCRVLLDSYTSSQNTLMREMRLYSIQQTSEYFNGDISSFSEGNSFFTNYDKRNCKIYNSEGLEESEHTI